MRRPSKSGKGVKRDAATLGWLESGHPNAKKMTKLFSRLAVAGRDYFFFFVALCVYSSIYKV